MTARSRALAGESHFCGTTASSPIPRHALRRELHGPDHRMISERFVCRVGALPFHARDSRRCILGDSPPSRGAFAYRRTAGLM